MMHRQGFNNKINSLDEKALRITYEDTISSSQSLSRKDIFVSINQKTLKLMATEMFNIYILIWIMKELTMILAWKRCHKIYGIIIFSVCPVYSAFNCTKALLYLGTKNWDRVLNEIKQFDSFKKLKLKTKKWASYGWSWLPQKNTIKINMATDRGNSQN